MLSTGARFLRRVYWILSITYIGPRYNSTALESHLASVLGDVSLSAVENVQLLVPSYAIALPKEDPPGNTCAPMFFRSWQARGLLVPAGANAAEYDSNLLQSLEPIPLPQHISRAELPNRLWSKLAVRRSYF